MFVRFLESQRHHAHPLLAASFSPRPSRRVLLGLLIAFAVFLLGNTSAQAQGGDAAQFISQTTPPAELQSGLPYPVTVTMKNTGTTTWTTGPQPANAQPSGYMLVSASPLGTDIWNTIPGIGYYNNSVPISATGPSASVAPGQTATFTFIANAPSPNPGSYNFQWQMMHNFVRFFGDVTPNVVCSVLTDNAAFVSQVAPPATIVAGQSYPVSVTMQNTGTSTWQNGTCQILSENPRGNQYLTPSNTQPVVGTVLPGQSTTVSFNVVATTPGSYNFQWTMSRANIHEFGQFSTNVPVTVVAAPPALTAAATGANKITLYWSGVGGASGYNVYRSTVSGGPYTRIASGAATADPGPGMVNAFMYSDTAGLATGTEYFYVVSAVYSGIAGPQSNEASDIPQAGAVPWDTGDPAQIIPVVNSLVAPVLDPDMDPDTGDQSPAPVGILTASGPDGVLYQGNYADGSPPDVFPPSAVVDANTGIMTYADGTSVSTPAEPSAPTNVQPSVALPGDEWNARLSPNAISISDNYAYSGNYSGIWRKIESASGAWAEVGVCGLPNLTDPNSFNLASFPYPASTGKKGNYSDSGDIYFGGRVVATGGELDCGLQASPNSGGTWVPGWVPVVNPGSMIAPDGTTVGFLQGAVVTGLTLKVVNGNPKGWKMYAVNETKMQFLTPKSTGINNQVVLHLGRTYGVAGDDIRVVKVSASNGQYTLSAPTSYGGATLAYFAAGWEKSGPNSVFRLKRNNTIAQTLHNPAVSNPKIQHNGYPEANGPAETSAKSFLLDGSYIKGAYWGDNTDAMGVRINFGGSYSPWTNSSSQSSVSGAYPNSKLGGLGYVTWTDHNPFTYENNINLKASTQLP